MKNLLNKIKQNRFIAFCLRVNARYGKDNGSSLAAILTYYGFLSLFPLLLLVVSIIGFVLAGRPEQQAIWVSRVAHGIPGLGDLLGQTLGKVVKARAGAGVIGLVSLAWTGLAIIENAEFCLGQVFKVERVKSFIRRKVEGFAIMAGLGAVTLTSIAVPAVFAGIKATGPASVALRVGLLLLTFGLDLTTFAVAYRLLIPQRGPGLGHLWQGSLFAAAGWTLLKLGGSWFVGRSVHGAAAVYGAFGAVVGALALINLASRLFMYGAEINGLMLDERGEERTVHSDEETDESSSRFPEETPAGFIRTIDLDGKGSRVEPPVEPPVKPIVEQDGQPAKAR